MTSADPHEVAAGILAQTGIDLNDPVAAETAAGLATRRAVRQVLGTLGGSVLAGAALICLVLTFAPATHGDDPGTGARVAFGVVGLVLAGAAAWTLIWAWRLSAAYRAVYLPRQAALRRYLAETGRPWNPLGDADALRRAVIVATSTPSEVREMKAAERAAIEQPHEPDDPEVRP